jgi:hypothetical protein
MKRASAYIIIYILSISLPIAAWGGPKTLHFNGDAELMKYLSEVVFTAEGLIGDLTGPAHELDMGVTTMDLVITANYPWQSGVTVPFTLNYNDDDGSVCFTVGGEALHYTTPHSGFDAIFVRTRAVYGGSSVRVDNLVLNSWNINDFSQSVGPDGRDVLLIYGLNISYGFTLSGNAVLSWTGPPPVGQALAFQIKVARSAVVSTAPSTWGAIKSLYR